MTHPGLVQRPARILYDERWQGLHGIGRFLANVTERIPMDAVGLDGGAASPWSPLQIARGLSQAGPYDLFYSPGFTPPWPAPRRPFVLTLHDLNHLDLSYNSSPAKRLFYRSVLLPACQSAAAIFTVSDFSRTRILDWCRVPPERVVNVSNGASDAFFNGGEAHREGAPYFLVVGIRKRHKNQEAIVCAFSRCSAATTHRLLFVGNSTPALQQLIEGQNVSASTRFLGPVTESKLAELYRGASALVFPSLYEGFGMPVVEAMACGCPVITSTTTALPEVAGDAAMLVDPADVAAIASAMGRVAEDASLRAGLSLAGLERARHFRWDTVCTRMRSVFRTLLPDGVTVPD